ncbi:substrate-binding periplasmic protein [Oxalobacteraceae bacterium A2-2]
MHIFSGCLLYLALALPCAAQQVRVAAQEGTEPKFQLADDQKVVGICIDILQAVEKLQPGLSFIGQQTVKPLPRIFSELLSGQEDIACALQYTPQRAAQFHFFGPAVYQTDYHLLARMDDPVIVHNWDDVRKLGKAGVVLANRGFAAATMLSDIGGLVFDASSASPQLNLQKLIAGRGRLYFHHGPGLPRLLERNGMAGKVRILPTVLYQAQMVFAAGPKADPAAIARIEQALFQLERSGELERIVKRWD